MAASIVFTSWSVADGTTVWSLGDISVITYTPGTTFLGGALATMGITISGSDFSNPVSITCQITGPSSGFGGSALIDTSSIVTFTGSTAIGTVSNFVGIPSPINGSHTLKASLGTATPGGGTVTFTFSYNTGGGNIPLCWTLTCMRRNGKLFQTRGSGRLPSEIKVPHDCDPSTSIVYEDGIFIPQHHYKLVHDGVQIKP